MASVKSSNTNDVKVSVSTSGEVTPHHKAELLVGSDDVSVSNPIPVSVVSGAEAPVSAVSGATAESLLADIKQILSESAPASELAEISDEIASDTELTLGLVRRAIGTDGALRNSDAPALISGAASVASRVIVDVDTTGYQSISLQLFGTWAGTVSFVVSNDRATWYAISGWPSAAAQLPVAASTTNGLWIFPAVGRFFRAYISAYTSGTVSGSAYLRTQAMPLPSVPSVNNAQVAGTAMVTAGVAGLQAIGGNIAAGVAPTSNPVLTGGIDTAGKTRRRRVSPDGDAIHAAIDAQGTARAVQSTASGAISITEPGGLLEAILLEVQKQTMLLSLLPAAINSGQEIDLTSTFINDSIIN
jgi:hypothetical protein